MAEFARALVLLFGILIGVRMLPGVDVKAALLDRAGWRNHQLAPLEPKAETEMSYQGSVLCTAVAWLEREKVSDDRRRRSGNQLK